MSFLRLKTEGARTAFHPGEVLAGTADWELDGPPRPGDAVELRLLWFTNGWGIPDTVVVATARFDSPGERGERDFRFQLPEGPYSFVGRLITLNWALEGVLAGKSLGRLEITVSPSGEPVLLDP